MGQNVIVHRFEEQVRGVRGQRRVVESGVFDPDADDNPDWVKEALADRAKAEPQPEHELAETDEDAVGNVAAVLDTVEFGTDTSLPDGMDEEPEPDGESVSDGGNVAPVINSVPFGVDSDEPSEEAADGADSGEDDEPEKKASPRRRKAADES